MIEPAARKHPHGRGEDFFRRTISFHFPETPPRAWGRLPVNRTRAEIIGNTPTGVGKTDLLRESPERCEKHPHGRGEDPHDAQIRRRFPETPPRAWGRPMNCAVSAWSRRKHPHGRGEDRVLYNVPLGSRETPPRAWGRPNCPSPGAWSSRNTPTGVGKTGDRKAQA